MDAILNFFKQDAITEFFQQTGFYLLNEGGWKNLVMIGISLVLLYLAIKK